MGCFSRLFPSRRRAQAPQVARRGQSAHSSRSSVPTKPYPTQAPAFNSKNSQKTYTGTPRLPQIFTGPIFGEPDIASTFSIAAYEANGRGSENCEERLHSGANHASGKHPGEENSGTHNSHVGHQAGGHHASGSHAGGDRAGGDSSLGGGDGNSGAAVHSSSGGGDYSSGGGDYSGGGGGGCF